MTGNIDDNLDISYYRVQDVRNVVRRIKEDILVKYCRSSNPYQEIDIRKYL